MENIPKIIDKLGCSETEANDICVQLWTNFSEEGKQQYEEMQKKDKLIYENQMNELKDKGFFTFENGTKSTDDYNKNLEKKTLGD